MSSQSPNGVNGAKATYKMWLDRSLKISGSMEEVIVHSMTKNYLKFQSHLAGIKPKAVEILAEEDTARYKCVSDTLNGFLIDGHTGKSVGGLLMSVLEILTLLYCLSFPRRVWLISSDAARPPSRLQNLKHISG
jgi:hypothetical protein